MIKWVKCSKEKRRYKINIDVLMHLKCKNLIVQLKIHVFYLLFSDKQFSIILFIIDVNMLKEDHFTVGFIKLVMFSSNGTNQSKQKNKSWPYY